MTIDNTLDQRYLEFAGRTADAFARFPKMEPLRHFVFRELLVQQRSMGWSVGAKHALQRVWQGGRTRRCDERVDVLIWVESNRDVIADTLLPIHRELVSRGAKVQLVSYGGPHDLPPSTLTFQHQPFVVAPAWTRPAWDLLCLLFQELRKWGLYRAFYHSCAIVESLFDSIQELLDSLQPKVVLCAASNLIGGSAIMMASRWQGSRPLLLQHGVTQAFYTPLISEYMVTWGNSSNSTLSALGVPMNRLLPLGSPRHDPMGPALTGEARRTFLQALSLPDKPTLVFFSNGNDLLRNGQAPLECVAWLQEVAASKRNSLNVVVRLHPNEDGSLYKHCHDVRLTKRTPDLATTLGGCDVVGSLCSTVLYDALLFEKPVLQFHRHGWPELADNWRDNSALKISSSAELEEMLGLLLPGSKDYEATVRDQRSKIPHVFANHGFAGKAIAEHVLQYL